MKIIFLAYEGLLSLLLTDLICSLFIQLFINFTNGFSKKNNSTNAFADSCICSSDVHVHLYILFFIQDWNANVLFIYTETNKFGELAYDMLVSVLVFLI